MTNELPSQRVELTFVGLPPARQIVQAIGVTQVEVDGHRVSCLVCGSFQPFLEALRGYEVVSLTSTATPSWTAPTVKEERSDDSMSPQ